ncbi:MAG: hypothetical protein ACRD5B_13930, partial [Nitrososphaeraceae archaeon]
MVIVLENNIKNPVDYCISVILKEAKEETRLVKQVMYVMLSTYTNNPLNLGINSPSGEGKNWVLEKVSEKFPSEDVISLAGMTEKALFHRRGDLIVNRNDLDKAFPKEYVMVDSLIKELDNKIDDKDNEMMNSRDSTLKKALKEEILNLEEEKKSIYKYAKKLIDLSHKTLIFLDTPKMGLLSAIMTLLSHDKYEVEYEFVDTNNGIKTHTNVLRGWPAVIFAQAVDYSKYERWPELQRRFIITNPEMNSKKKYSEAVDLTLDKFGLPDFVYQKVVSSDEEKNRVKDIIKYVAGEIKLVSDRIQPGKNSTFIPYAEALKSVLSKDKA